ncbi:MAG: hypothetical protein WCG85_13490 [Polyangia bacterium]
MKRIVGFWSALTLAVCVQAGCGTSTSSNASAGEAPDGQGSEIATSVVSGALNNTEGSALGWNSPRRRVKQATFERVLEVLSPVGVAWAATWTCTGGTLNPAFAGPASDPYTYTPVSCNVTWKNGKTASSIWDGSFTLSYGSSCDAVHPFIGHQAAGCSLTRTTGADGNKRTLTGPDGNSYAITHNTNGAGTGYDATVSPAPSDDGVVVTCGTSGCDTDGTLVINGSHLTGTVISAAGESAKLWDHTVTGTVDVAGTGSGRVVTGTVIVEHNLVSRTTSTAFNSVTYGDAFCCFPTAGSVTTTKQNGPHVGKTEMLTFSSVCGEATLTTYNGSTVALTLEHCI